MQIATLIPAMRPKFLLRCVNSVLRQTVKPDLIIIADDSHNREIQNILKGNEKIFESAGIQLQVEDGARTNRAFDNLKKLRELWEVRSEFFHVLLDDDFIFPTFYRSHLELMENNAIDVSVSRRWTADKKGEIVAADKVPQFIETQQSQAMLIDPVSAFTSIIPNCDNWFGELSNAFFRKEAFPVYTDYKLNEIYTYGLGDISIFLHYCKERKLAFLNKHLGYRCTHDQQITGNFNSPEFLAGFAAWFPIAIAAKNLNLISEAQKQQCFNRISKIFWKNELSDHDINNFIDFFKQNTKNIIHGKYFDEDEYLKKWQEFSLANL